VAILRLCLDPTFSVRNQEVLIDLGVSSGDEEMAVKTKVME